MLRFRCQCLGFLFGLMLSMGVSAATGWLVVEEMPARSVPLSTPAASFADAEAVPSPLPLILMASGLLGLVLVVGKLRGQP
ncbi:MAG: hypothetical protein CMN57_07335 [Gammaproteobacteria bacterium]|nr:hypothetical protein [Gammaproteobacteria bacterium]